MDTQEKFVAVGLLTQRAVDALGSSLRRVFIIDEVPRFTELLKTLDEAEDRTGWVP